MGRRRGFPAPGRLVKDPDATFEPLIWSPRVLGTYFRLAAGPDGANPTSSACDSTTVHLLTPPGGVLVGTAPTAGDDQPSGVGPGPE